MKELLQSAIEQMRNHVLKNIELIKTNELHIKEVLSWPLSSDRTKELNESYKFSKNLLSENNDFINLQVSIMNFMNKYKQALDIKQPVNVTVESLKPKDYPTNRDECFKLTVQNSIPFDAHHPFFNDEAFYNDVFAYFQEKENYEMCATLLKLKHN